MKILVTLLICFHTLAGYAQFKSIGHYEVTIEDKKGADYKLITTPDNQVFVILFNKEIFSKGFKQVETTLLNSRLEPVWNLKMSAKKIQTYVSHYYEAPYLYILLEERRRNYVLFKINSKTGTYSEQVVQNGIRIFITHLKVFDEVIYFGGLLNNQPFIAHKTFEEQSFQFVKSLSISRALLANFFVSRSYLFVFMYQDKNYKRDLFVNRYDLNGNLLFNFSVPRDERYRLRTHQFFIHDLNSFSIVGMFSLKNQRKPQGFYLYSFLDNQLVKKVHIEFTRFKNIFKHFKERREEKLWARVKKRIGKNKDYRFAYALFFHQIKKQEDSYYITADAYQFQESRYENLKMHTYGYGSRSDLSMQRFYRKNFYESGDYIPNALNQYSYSNNNYVSSFNYSHGITAKLSANGRLAWDNLFNYDEDVSSEFPLDLLETIEYSDSLLMLYQEKDDIKYKVSSKKQYTDSLRSFRLSDVYYPHDTATVFVNGGVIKLPDSSLLLSGYKKLRSKESRKDQREVFYLLRLIYENKK